MDIFADIVDNYGDMGWVIEFLMMSRLSVHFRVVTDAPLKMGDFMKRSGSHLPPYEVIDKNTYDHSGTAKVVILGLHAKVDFTRF